MRLARFLPVTVLFTLTFACSQGGGADGDVSSEGALGTQQQAVTLECLPVDADEACAEGSDIGEYCVDKISVTRSGQSSELVVERKSSGDTRLPNFTRNASPTFRFGPKKLNASWNDGDVSLSATRSDTVSKYVGQLTVEDGVSFMVECKVAGAPDLPRYIKSVVAFDECNGRNAQGQQLRCVKGATCQDGDGNELTVLSSKKGVCIPSFLRTAKQGEACNLNPPGSAAIIECERGVGLKCKDTGGAEIALAERNAPSGTCQH